MKNGCQEKERIPDHNAAATVSTIHQADEDSEFKLGLSLGLQTMQEDRNEEETTDEEKGIESWAVDDSSKHLKVGELAGVTSQSINPTSGKTRVSIRTRCPGPTVSV